MSNADTELNEKLIRIFMPLMLEKRDKIRERQGRFVHYTTSDNALQIIRTKRVWMRSSQCMNDFMEVEHGYEMLRSFFSDTTRKTTFCSALNGCSPNIAEESVGLFDSWWPQIRSDTYITCISEHDDDEDTNGRLSMWRAYRQGSLGVALVFKSDPFMLRSDALKAYSSPVSYLGEQAFHRELFRVVANINAHCAFLVSVPRQLLLGYIFNMLLFGVTCSKHPGFHEEREWRIIHVPSYSPSTVLEKSIEVVAGVPQPVFKIPLEDIPEEGLVGIEIPRLLDRIIVGPSQFPFAVYQAFVHELAKAGVVDASSRITISNIPLRT